MLGIYVIIMEEKSKGKKTPLYRFIKWMVSLFYKKREFIGTENIPSEPCIIVSNHAQAHGPVTYELYFPAPKKIWCIGQMMRVKEVPNYSYEDFWSHKPSSVRWLYRILSYLIAIPSAYLFTHADTIGVYKDARLRKTFRDTEKALLDGYNVVIFPEKLASFNEIINEFQDKFIDVARHFYRVHGKALYFVPSYNSPALKKVVFGKPILFDPNKDIAEVRAEICDYLKNEITALAKSLPLHRVVPYDNIPKSKYPYSKKFKTNESVESDLPQIPTDE